MNDESVYWNKGYKNRTEYLLHISEVYGIPYDTVKAVANTLGQNEDFDGLIAILEDWED